MAATACARGAGPRQPFRTSHRPLIDLTQHIPSIEISSSTWAATLILIYLIHDVIEVTVTSAPTERKRWPRPHWTITAAVPEEVSGHCRAVSLGTRSGHVLPTRPENYYIYSTLDRTSPRTRPQHRSSWPSPSSRLWMNALST